MMVNYVSEIKNTMLNLYDFLGHFDFCWMVLNIYQFMNLWILV